MPRRTGFTLWAVITGTGGAKKGSTRRSNTFSRQSRKTPVTLSPTPGWPIPTCSWDGTAICRQRKRSLKAKLRRTIELDPNYPVTYWILGLVLRKTSSYELAITEGERAVKLSGGSPLMRATLAHTLGTAGRTMEAFQMLDDLTKLAKQKYVAPYFFAGVHIVLGENDRAMEYLEKSYEEHSHWLIYLHMDPTMDGLRNNPRFQDLSRRVGLPALKAAIPT